VIVPGRPDELITEFLPKYFAELTSAAAKGLPQSALGRAPAPVGVVLRVVDSGAWTLRIVGGKLLVEASAGDDAALQISLHERDFSTLVSKPLERALQALERAPLSEQQRATALGALWSRLGRWDQETVDLLKRQSGRILVRIEDAGSSRNVSLTPGTRPYSLEEGECTIDCRLQDLEDLQSKRGSPLDLFYSGQIRIGGDAQVALAMAGLFL
jgi:SCP-2 sterol transfer family protein